MSRSILVLAACLAWATSAQAQTADRPGGIEVEAGGGWFTGGGLGASDAALVDNDPIRRPSLLFTTETESRGAPHVLARAAFALSRRLAIEGGLVWSRPEIETSITGDVEGAPDTTVVQRVDQYLFEGGAVYLFDRGRAAARTVPYAGGGGGYLRQLHEGRTLVEHGGFAYGAGGLKHWLTVRPGAGLSAVGVRADARLYFLMGGISVDDELELRVALSGSLFFTF